MSDENSNLSLPLSLPTALLKQCKATAFQLSFKVTWEEDSILSVDDNYVDVYSALFDIFMQVPDEPTWRKMQEILGARASYTQVGTRDTVVDSLNASLPKLVNLAQIAYNRGYSSPKPFM